MDSEGKNVPGSGESKGKAGSRNLPVIFQGQQEGCCHRGSMHKAGMRSERPWGSDHGGPCRESTVILAFTLSKNWCRRDIIQCIFQRITQAVLSSV